MADTVLSIQELEEFIDTYLEKRQELQDEIKFIEEEMEQLDNTIEQIETVKKYQQQYKYYKENLDNKPFVKEYSARLSYIFLQQQR